jgi:hypothetical protein
MRAEKRRGGMSPISSALWTRARQGLERPTSAHEEIRAIPLGQRIAALVLRTVFIGILVVLVARVSSPLNETIWSAYETPGDLIRVVVGLVACLWMLYSVFALPKDAEAYRSWIYISLLAGPLALACVIVFW